MPVIAPRESGEFCQTAGGAGTMLIEKAPASPFGGASTQAGSHRFVKQDYRGAELATQPAAGRPGGANTVTPARKWRGPPGW